GACLSPECLSQRRALSGIHRRDDEEHIELADREKANITGMLIWAFEFENQPWFDGFRALATNGVDKPMLNVFRMAGLMGGERIEAESDGRVQLDRILASGVGERPDIDGLAMRSETRRFSARLELSRCGSSCRAGANQDDPLRCAGVRSSCAGSPLPDRRRPQQRLDRLESGRFSTASFGRSVRETRGRGAVANDGLAPLGGSEERQRNTRVYSAGAGGPADPGRLAITSLYH
ncbi:MAG TPA: hypothetical protein VG345_14130, partial [Bryobacteraceae bacterium]|nr:hypothetical protein [Bryobacteraceae bacterium]